jgi:hypothetical protein
MRIVGLLIASGLTLALAAPEAARLGPQDRARGQAAAQTAITGPKAADTQTPPPPGPPPQPPPPSKNIQVDVTVNLEGGASPISKRMTLVAAEGSVALGRSGIEVPVPQAIMGGGSSTPVQSFNYRTVGLNVDARPKLVDGNRINLWLKLDFSAVLKSEASGPSAGMPAFGNAKTDINLVLDSAKPLTITQSADAEIGRGYSVEVKATILR